VCVYYFKRAVTSANNREEPEMAFLAPFCVFPQNQRIAESQYFQRFSAIHLLYFSYYFDVARVDIMNVKIALACHRKLIMPFF
jgi:hypothetical protein